MRCLAARSHGHLGFRLMRYEIFNTDGTAPQQQQAKSVGFADDSSASEPASSTVSRVRPLTAPARAGSRLAAGAARVSSRPAKDTTAVNHADTKAAAKRRGNRAGWVG